MEIYRIEDYKKTKKLVYFSEGAPAFCLYNKGISKEVAEEAFNGTDVNETEAVRDLIIKKFGSIDKYNELSFEEKSGFIRKFMAKGFSYDCVRSAGEISGLYMIDIIPERQ